MPIFTANRLAGHTIVFDLDGTLVDTAPDLLGCIDRILALRGLAPAPHAIIKPLISIGSKAMMKRGFAYHNITLPEDELHALWLQYLQLYAANIATSSRPFAGIPTLLPWLKDQGATLAVCTNKNEAMAKALLVALQMDGIFKYIAGRDTFAEQKPHPDHLLKTIAAAGGDSKKAIMVGDSDVDIATAKAARVPVIAVTFGYTPEPVATFGPDVTIDDYSEFRAALAQILSSNAA
jgi:phosphoglycolate phosphatase